MSDDATLRMPPLVNAAIIAVGSELLTPTRLDTNSLFITEQLNALGVDVVAKAVVGDDRRRLIEVFNAFRRQAGLIVFSGGLGPTDDDVTREAVAAALDLPLKEDVQITAHLRARFAARGDTTPMPENNRRQAMVPEGAEVLENTRGSAPGLWIDNGEQVVLLLPGPPREMRPMLTALTAGPLRERTSGEVLLRRVLKIAGRIESQTDEVLQPLYREWLLQTPPVAATILAQLGQLEVHLTARDEARDRANAALAAAVSQVLEALGDDVFSSNGQPLEEVVGELLVKRGWTIGAAESCTGGLITSRLTDIAGSSRYVMQSVVTYSNEAKVTLLGVSPDAIAEHGAVSEAVALAMAAGMRSHAGVDVGIGVTGIAGPGGGTPEKPVGTVAVAAVTARMTRSRVFRFMGEREQIKFQASQAALDMVRRILLIPDS
ncbi:MAG TPA: competence/damage-inducible protein A [Vicinamibacterales bacterium]|nr:competence/damage-inducible protein A [Vicinamibacterales bacterium]